MDKTFIINSHLNKIDLKDAISERLVKAKAITSSILFNDSGEMRSGNIMLYGSVWAVDDFLDEVNILWDALSDDAE